jgi:hypothetical protein
MNEYQSFFFEMDGVTSVPENTFAQTHFLICTKFCVLAGNYVKMREKSLHICTKNG